MSKTPGPVIVPFSARIGMVSSVPGGQTVSQWPMSNWKGSLAGRCGWRVYTRPPEARPGRRRTDIPDDLSSTAEIAKMTQAGWILGRRFSQDQALQQLNHARALLLQVVNDAPDIEVRQFRHGLNPANGLARLFGFAKSLMTSSEPHDRSIRSTGKTLRQRKRRAVANLRNPAGM